MSVGRRQLDKNPARRPHSLRVIEGLLADVCESLELEPSRAAIQRWAAIAPKLAVVPAPVQHKPSYVVVLADEDVVAVDDDEEEEEDEVEEDAAPGPLRFDMWAVAACAFCVIAFTMATQL
ncbi:MAG: hypothetical protein Q8N23_20555 [Archangium sp.]|nr:hypothetical protein [Archangium sp.]